MDIGNIENIESEHRWIKWKEDAELLMAYITPKMLNKITRKTTRIEFERGKSIEKQDTVEANRLVGRAVVKGWRGLTSEGEDFPFNDKNLDMMMGKSYDFSNFVNGTAIEIANFITEATEESVGKLESTPSGGLETA